MGKRQNYDFELSFFEGLYRRMPRDQRVVAMLAQLYTKTGQVDSGLRMDRKLVRMTPDDPLNHYNLACSLALKGRKADAVKSLRAAIALGYEDFSWMINDPDLAGLKDYPGYALLLGEILK